MTYSCPKKTVMMHRIIKSKLKATQPLGMHQL